MTIAAWFRYLHGQDDQSQPIAGDDLMAELLSERARSGGADPSLLLSLSELFGDLSQSFRFVETVTNQLGTLYAVGAKATLTQLLQVHSSIQ